MAFDASKRPTPPPAKPAARKPSPAAQAKRGAREEGINGLFQLGTAVCMMTGQHADAAAFATHGPKIAPEVASIAEDYEKVGEVIDKLIAVGPFAGLLTAVLPLALQLAVNHGRGNAAVFADFGVVSKETLEAQGQAAALRQATAAVESQRQAEAEFIAAQRAAMAQAEQSQNGARPEMAEVR